MRQLPDELKAQPHRYDQPKGNPVLKLLITCCAAMVSRPCHDGPPSAYQTDETGSSQPTSAATPECSGARAGLRSFVVERGATGLNIAWTHRNGHGFPVAC